MIDYTQISFERGRDPRGRVFGVIYRVLTNFAADTHKQNQEGGWNRVVATVFASRLLCRFAR